jgi:hypothetical protein
MHAVAMLPAANARERKNFIGSIGSGARSSQATNVATRARPATREPTTSALPQPAGLPRTSPHVIPSAPALMRSRPRTSSRLSLP